MNFKLKFSLLLFVTFVAFSCNSNKKKVESDGKDYNNFNRVGSVDTMQDKDVLPGNVQSINAYVITANKGIRNELRETSESGSGKSIILGGKGSNFIKSSSRTSGSSNSSYDFYYKDNKLLFVESTEVIGQESVSYRYYFDGNNIATMMKGVGMQGGKKSEGGVDYETVPVEAAKAAQLIALAEQNKVEFSKLPPYKAKVYKSGDKYTATTCYEGKEYMLVDKNGYLAKIFKDISVAEGKFVLINLRGTKSADMKTMEVQAGDFIASENGVIDCF